jgi:branched-chain amino acid transport system ATP-binding protein
MPAILEVDNVTKSFGGVRAVDGASFRLAAPGIYGLIGPNGAGKTTLFDVICGRQFADTGSVRLAEERIDHLRVHQRARLGLARTFQECRVLEAETCLDNVHFAAQDKHLGSEMTQAASRSTGARRSVTEEAERLLDLVNLQRLAAEPAGNLSYGQRRLLEIVSSIIAQPRLLLLDEPASGINPTLLNTLHDFLLRILAERQIVVLIVEHNMEFIMSLASHVLVMHQGRVLEEGPPAAIQSSQRVIEAYLG